MNGNNQNRIEIMKGPQHSGPWRVRRGGQFLIALLAALSLLVAPLAPLVVPAQNAASLAQNNNWTSFEQTLADSYNELFAAQSALAQNPSGGVEFKIAYNSGTSTYEVYMRPQAVPAAPNETLTAQVTVKVPHSAGDSFTPTAIASSVVSTTWAIDSRTDDPGVASGFDYISFGLTMEDDNFGAFNWSNSEQLVFTFQNSGSCLGAVTLMEDSDPFNVPPNNPGNAISISGLGGDPGNDYIGTYDVGQADCTPTNTAPTITQPAIDPASISIPENTTTITDVNTTDLEDTLEISLTYGLSGPDAGLMSIDTNGNLAFTTAPDFETPGDVGSNNIYDVTITVTDTGGLTDTVDIAVGVSDVTEVCDYTVTNTNATGAGSLAQAILDANTNAGAETICFNIPGAGPHTIVPTTNLDIVDEVTLDGGTQPGASCGPTRDLRIILDGSTATDALSVYANNVTIRGLVLHSYSPGRALRVGSTSTNTVIECNHIGTDAAGIIALGNSNDGIVVRDTATNTRIGTNGDGNNDDAERNIISGNARDGIHIFGTADGTVVAGNYIGTDITGTSALSNGRFGIVVTENATNTRIGTDGDGTADATERNLISGNGDTGIFILTNANATVVAGNYIGTDVNGTSALGNGNSGIWLGNDVANTRIGTDGDGTADAAERNIISGNTGTGLSLFADVNGTVVAGNYIGTDVTGASALSNGSHGIRITGNATNNRSGTNWDGINDAAESNLIAYNGNAGVDVSTTAVDNAILGNRIFGNGGLGIDLSADGVTPNDAGDGDSGANDLLNHPVIRSVSGTTVDFYFDVPAGNYLLEIYDNPSGLDSSFYGEGETLVYTETVAITAGGMTHSATLPTAPGNSGQRLAATLTEDLGGGTYGSTSEFSGADPVANDDTESAVVSSTGNIFTVTTNDTTEWYTDTLAIDSVSTPTGGTISGFNANTVTYDAPATPGDYTFTYVISNTAGVTATATVTINVTAANSAPTITQPVNDPATISIPENTTAITDVNTTDDSGTEGTGTLTYTISGPDAISMTINSSTGVLSFIAAPDFESPGSAAGSNTYTVTVTVTDTGGLTDTVVIVVTINDVVESTVAPGGVSDDLNGWYLASDATATTWADAAQGIGDLPTVVGTPSIIVNGLNFHPVAGYDGASYHYVGGLSTHDVIGGASVDLMAIAVYSSNSGGGVTGHGGNTRFAMLSSRGRFGDNQNQHYGVNIGDGIYEIQTMVKDVSSNIYARQNGLTVFTGSEPDSENTASDDFKIGKAGGESSLVGQVAEVIIYSTDQSAGLAQIESYLALKYGITLDQTTATAYLASDGSTKMWDETVNATYNSDIFGIGRDDASGLDQRVSKSVNNDGIVTLATTADFVSANADGARTSLTDLNFQTIANNDGSATWTATGAPTHYNLLERQWQVQETGTVSGVYLAFDVADADFGVPILQGGTNYYLIYDSNNNDDLSDETPMALTNSGGNIWETSTNIDFTDGMEFTLATLVAPTITQPVAGGPLGAAAITIPENTTAITDVNTIDISDSEGSGLTYGLSGPDAGAMTIDASGNLAFTSAPDFENPGSAASSNTYTVTVTVTDTGNLTDSVVIVVNVTNDPADDNAGIEYKIVYNGGTGLYEIWMRATVTPTLPGTTGTAQVTIKAPHLTGSGVFSPTNITAQVADTAWAVGSRTDAPAQDTGADYISFALSFPTANNAAINWLGGQEILMFTFANAGVCAGDVTLMEDSDPFNVPPNNPGQQIDVFGLASDPANDFIGNYGLGQADCGPADLTVSIGQPDPTLTAGMTSTVPVTVTNVGTATATGPLTATVTLPTGVTAPASFTDNGWTCTTSGATVTCVNAGPINGSASSSFGVPVIPDNSTIGTTPTPFSATVDPALGEQNTANNGPVTMTPTSAVTRDAQIEVVKSVDNMTPTIGDTITFTIRITNTGPSDAANVLITDVVQSGFSYVASSITGGDSSDDSDPGGVGLRWTVNSLVADASTAVSFQATVNASGIYTNTAEVGDGSTGGGVTPIDPPGLSGPGIIITPTAQSMMLPMRFYLGGAYDSTTGQMGENLRALPDFPLTSPYGGGETIGSSAILTANNIVDWVWVELRDSTVPTTVVASQAALLQADGDMVDTDGTSTLAISGTVAGNYYVAVHHRNHLSVMSGNPISVTTTTALVDFTLPSTSVYGTHARQINNVTGAAVLWPGDANQDGQVIASGPNNDRNLLLQTVFTAPGNQNFAVNYIADGYQVTDLNLDGMTLASGPNNDDNVILSTVFLQPNNSSFATNFIVEEQMP